MNKKIIALALASAVVTSASAAQAKETTTTTTKAKPVAIKQAAKSTSSKTGNMYLRGDVGYGVSSFRTTNFRENAKATILSAGVGSKVADNVRAELQVYHTLGGAEAKKKASTGAQKFEQHTTAVFGNVYYDFNNSSMFTPYVMAGAGMAHNKIKSNQAGLSSKAKNQLALQTGAGVATKIADNTFLDVRYNLMNKGRDVKTQNGQKFKTHIEHAAMVGVRVHF